MANVLGELFGDIASAIRDKTGDTEKMKPAQFPEKISEIETGVDVSGVTATAPHVLEGDVFVDADGNPVNGTMKNNGAVLKKLRYSGYDEKYTYTIPEGYHDGTGIVEVRCDSEQIVYPSKYRQRLYGTPIRDNDWNLTGYNFLGHVVIDPIPDQYQDVTPVTATAEDVRAGKVFVDAEGNAVEGALSGTIADVSGVTATAADVRQGKIIVDAQGNEVVGTLVVEQKAPDVIWVGKDNVANALVGTGVVRYVTFMNDDGTAVYGQKSVLVGTDCIEPVAGGYMDAPTKESTAEHTFTFSGGWATVPNGGKDSNALKNVTEDRTVYANFIAAVRYYNARFYSDGKLVATVQTAYGAQAVPPVVPGKDGYTLDGWNPSNLTVYGDTDFNAVWTELTGYYYITTLSGFPNQYINDIAINNSGTDIAIGMSGNAGDPYVYDISGNTPVLKTQVSAGTGSIQNYDFNYNDTLLWGHRKSVSSSKHQSYYLQYSINNGAYKLENSTMLGSQAYIYSNIMRCSPVDDTTAKGFSGSNSQLNLNGKDIDLGGSQAAYGDFSPDGKLFAVRVRTSTPADSGGQKYGVKIYNVSDATLLRTVGESSATVSNASFNKDGTLIAVIKNKAPYVEVYNVSTGELVHSFDGILSASGTGCFVKGSNDLIVADGTTVRVFDCSAAEPAEITTIPTYQSSGVPVFMRSNRNGTRVGIVNQTDGTVEIWGKS